MVVGSTHFGKIAAFVAIFLFTATLIRGPRQSPSLDDTALVWVKKACAPTNCVLRDAEFSPHRASVLLTSTRTNITALKAKDSPDANLVTVQYRKLSSTEMDKYEYRKGLFIYKEPYHLQNIGHVLGDDIFAICSSIFDRGLHNLSASDIWMILPSDFEKEITRRSIIIQHYRLVSSNPILFSRSQVKNTHRVVYENLLTGWDGYGYSMGHTHGNFPTTEKVEAFRRRAFSLFDVKERETQGRCNVLFLEKNIEIAHHKYSISNIDELLAALRAATTCTIEKVSWYGMSLRDQIAKMHDKNIVVSLPGSDLMNCIFQPTHSGMIVPDKCNEGGICTGSNEVGLWFARMPSRLVVTLPAVNSGLSWKGNRGVWNATHFVETVVRMNNLLHSP